MNGISLLTFHFFKKKRWVQTNILQDLFQFTDSQVQRALNSNCNRRTDLMYFFSCFPNPSGLKNCKNLQWAKSISVHACLARLVLLQMHNITDRNPHLTPKTAIKTSAFERWFWAVAFNFSVHFRFTSLPRHQWRFRARSRSIKSKEGVRQVQRQRVGEKSAAVFLEVQVKLQQNSILLRTEIEDCSVPFFSRRELKLCFFS